LGHQEQALVFYEASTIYGKKSKEYYGPYACIFMGDIYLKQGKRTLAKQFYTRATTYSNNQEYIQTIEQRAKSGLKQLK
jgi:predicted negative regulator of RcsB-dependent stress response